MFLVNVQTQVPLPDAVFTVAHETCFFFLFSNKLIGVTKDKTRDEIIIGFSVPSSVSEIKNVCLFFLFFFYFLLFILLTFLAKNLAFRKNCKKRKEYKREIFYEVTFCFSFLASIFAQSGTVSPLPQ